MFKRPTFPPRSGYETVTGIMMFGRTLDKIRLRDMGLLPEEYDLGAGLDEVLCDFLHVDFHMLVFEAVRIPIDEAILERCFDVGRLPTVGDVERFNHFMMKRGWRDDVSDWLRQEKERRGWTDRHEIQTVFDYLDAEEGRPPAYPVPVIGL